MHVVRKFTKKIKNKNLEINHNNNKISNTSSYKYLGVKLDQTLSLRDHVESVYKKASARLYLLKSPRTPEEIFNCLIENVCENFIGYFEVMTNNTRNNNNLIRLPRIKL